MIRRMVIIIMSVSSSTIMTPPPPPSPAVSAATTAATMRKILVFVLLSTLVVGVVDSAFVHGDASRRSSYWICTKTATTSAARQLQGRRARSPPPQTFHHHHEDGADAAAASTSTTSTTPRGTTAKSYYLLQWESLFDTVDWRISVGVDTAIAEWGDDTEVGDLLQSYSDDITWLKNKLAACHHALEEGSTSSTSTSSSPTCQYAMATRLILEEQELDGGQSVGKTGKYATKFHPSSSSSSLSSSPPDKLSASTFSSTSRGGKRHRPLTVGEITTNWNDMLRESLEIRYRCGQGAEMLQKQVVRQLEQSKYDVPRLRDKATVLPVDDPTKHILITVRHESDLDTAKQSLLLMQQLLFKSAAAKNNNVVQVVDNIDDAISENDDGKAAGIGVVTLLPKTETTVKRALELMEPGSTLYVVDNSLEALERERHLFGDDIPLSLLSSSSSASAAGRKSSGGGGSGSETIVKNQPHQQNNYLSLIMAGWASAGEQQRSAMMNPWMKMWSVFGEVFGD